MAKKSIYRMRPMNDKTLEELSVPYLWFSRRCGFNDPNDANVTAFINNNDNLLEILKERYDDEQINELTEKLDCTGICCFTKELPPKQKWKSFPHAKDGLICVEYDANILQNYFNLGVYALGECFKDVEYCDNPMFLDLVDGHDVKDMPNGDKLLTPLRSVFYEAKDVNAFITKMLTRISSKHDKQKEQRIILGGCNIPSFNPTLKGYEIKVPSESILRIHFRKGGKSDCFSERLSKLPVQYEISRF